jgi:hypothetical protein
MTVLLAVQWPTTSVVSSTDVVVFLSFVVICQYIASWFKMVCDWQMPVC